MANPTPDPHRDEPTPQPQEGMRPEADPTVVRPEQDEKNGPLPGLLATAAADVEHEIGVEDPEAEAQLEAAGVESEGIASAQIVGITVAILFSVFLMGLVVFWGFYEPFLDASEDSADAQIELAPEQRSILAQGMAALENYGMTADSSYTLPIGVAKTAVVEGYAGSAASAALDGEAARDELPVATTRQGFNVGPVILSAPGAVRAASSGAAPATDEATTIDDEGTTGEEVGVDDFPAADEPVINQ